MKRRRTSAAEPAPQETTSSASGRMPSPPPAVSASVAEAERPSAAVEVGGIGILPGAAPSLASTATGEAPEQPVMVAEEATPTPPGTARGRPGRHRGVVAQRRRLVGDADSPLVGAQDGACRNGR